MGTRQSCKVSYGNRRERQFVNIWQSVGDVFFKLPPPVTIRGRNELYKVVSRKAGASSTIGKSNLSLSCLLSDPCLSLSLLLWQLQLQGNLELHFALDERATFLVSFCFLFFLYLGLGIFPLSGKTHSAESLSALSDTDTVKEDRQHVKAVVVSRSVVHSFLLRLPHHTDDDKVVFLRKMLDKRSFYSTCHFSPFQLPNTISLLIAWCVWTFWSSEYS